MTPARFCVYDLFATFIVTVRLKLFHHFKLPFETTLFPDAQTYFVPHTHSFLLHNFYTSSFVYPTMIISPL